ncbi:MAG: KpsF/GutQ family sugar-phosphate isomerase [Candidatus Krumholzibacteriota bacterium]|nr:KpsF/GutQ family sugar-phosphate isomerase [Candidatus Krumholzibacteriota bacterium]
MGKKSSSEIKGSDAEHSFGESSGQRKTSDIGREVVLKEIEGLKGLHDGIGDEFEEAVKILLECPGKVIVCGIGKSGIIARKIAATLSSTGTPAVYLHSVEAGHGDMGMVTGNDVFLAVSKSGGNEEVTRLIPYLKAIRVKIISITASEDSRLAEESDVVLLINSKEEAGSIGVVPTTTTTVSLVLGDALAVAVLTKKNFSREDFAILHPGGVLGRKLFLKVSGLMHVEDELPLVSMDTSLKEALIEIIDKKLGCTGVTGPGGRLAGIITDGDLKRILTENPSALDTPVSKLMTKSPMTVSPNLLVVEALKEMEMNPKGQVTQLFVLDDEGYPVGIIHIHDILRAGLK